MTAPGWYNAQGDPPGSQRYWDGTQWVGEPVFEPAPSPGPTFVAPLPPPPVGLHPPGGEPPSADQLPTSVRTMAIVLSALKAIPLLFGLVGVVFLAALSNEIDDEFNEYEGLFDAAVGAATAFLVVMILIGGTLLAFQFAGAIKRSPMMVFVPALIMSIIDVLFAFGAWVSWNDSRNDFVAGEDSAFGAVMMTALAAAQTWIAVQAFRANRAQG